MSKNRVGALLRVSCKTDSPAAVRSADPIFGFAPRQAAFALSLMFWLLPIQTAAAFQGPDPQVPSSQQDKRDLVYYPGDVEHLKPFTRKLLSNIWLDQKTIWTSPFHMTRDDAGWWAGLGAITAAAIVTDRRTTHALENSAGQVRWGNNISKIGAVYTIAPEVAGFYLWGVVADNQKARETSVLAGEALLDGFIVVEVLKAAAGRNRPNAAQHPGNFFDGGASFPSGHSLATFALASVIAHEYGNRKWVPWVAYGLAGVVGTARFGARQHYASDVIAGSAMGFFIGRYVVNTHQAHAGHHHAALAPIVQPSTGTYGLSVSLRK
ncbi:MAG TPA: phosphatase PAP2 family protein [Bryobacteraceae bacterium]|nr:phosphatase PAP2 family protein [Bryobacteraceae bacterium]